jgi:hypothetical protein
MMRANQLHLQTQLPKNVPAANRRPAGQSDGSGNSSAIVAADRAFPAAVAELGRSSQEKPSENQTAWIG